MAFNVFDYLIGNPIDAVANQKFEAARKRLVAARLVGDKAAEIQALADMGIASKKLKAQSKKVVGQVENIDQNIKDATNFALFSTSLVAGVAGLSLLVFIIYKLKK